MRLDLESRVDCSDGTLGRLVDVVIDPTTRRVTHLVVEPDPEPRLARLVPVELAARGDDAGGVVMLDTTVAEVLRLPGVHETAYLRLGDFPVDDPVWDVGVQEVLAMPYYGTYDLEAVPLDYAITYDRVPKSEVEIRRESDVYASDGDHLGHVEGFVVDSDDRVTHLVLEHGHLWARREVTIPIGSVARVETDAATLSLTKDEVAALPEVAVQRWPTPGRREP
jgi:sporulation protein YlmC with PRC-barrel domain